MEKINWEVFTLDEKMHLKKMIQVGNYKDLAVPISMNSAKENEIEKIRKDLEPVYENFESTVVDNFYKENGRHPETPEEEAELESLMRKEAEEYKEKLLAKKNKRIREEAEEETKVPEKIIETLEEKKPIKKSNKSKK